MRTGDRPLLCFGNCVDKVVRTMLWKWPFRYRTPLVKRLQERWGQDLPRRVLESVALEGFRERILTTEELRQLLGFETKFERPCLPESARCPFLHACRPGARPRDECPAWPVMLVIADTSPLHYLVLIDHSACPLMSISYIHCQFLCPCVIAQPGMTFS